MFDLAGAVSEQCDSANAGIGGGAAMEGEEGAQEEQADEEDNDALDCASPGGDGEREGSAVREEAAVDVEEDEEAGNVD